MCVGVRHIIPVLSTRRHAAHSVSVPIFPPRMVQFLVMILESDFEYIFNASDQLLRVRSAARFKASRQGNRLLFAEIFS